MAEQVLRKIGPKLPSKEDRTLFTWIQSQIIYVIKLKDICKL